MDSSIAQWIAILDQVSHYELLGVHPNAGADALRKAYQGFAANFHPDAHMQRTPQERDSVSRIFKRGTEAYRILSDPQLRQKYEERRGGKSVPPPSTRGAPLPPGSTAPPGPSLRPGGGEPPRPGAASNITGRLEDFVKQPRARPFAQQAETLAKKGEHNKAKLQLKLALNFDPGNAALEAYLKQLDVLIEEGKKKPFVPK